ncbi:VOC family protein [Nisaea sp.]|uniref:VOC family protein n=1 Tax=Nisaea sp. TaxID=2024842 RepID=UPI003B51E614
MQLGTFSVSLSVKDLARSVAFYEALGFRRSGGDGDQGWAIMRNGNCVIGLFQGMFEGNLLTFNPGWDADANALEDFTDIRDIQRQLKNRGIVLANEADEDTTGPASCQLEDPDGNRILIDQHV